MMLEWGSISALMACKLNRVVVFVIVDFLATTCSFIRGMDRCCHPQIRAVVSGRWYDGY